MIKNNKFDALIIGAGAVAAVFAARLAEAGKNVLILESGPERTADDLISSQIWARRLKWGNHAINEFGGKDQVHTNMNFGTGFGGAAIHHYGVWPRFTPDDFQMKTRFKRGLDWPMSYDDLQPFYDRVQTFVGISGDDANEPGRPNGQPYPLKPVPAFRHAQLLSQGLNKIGVKTSAQPMSVLSEEYNGRKACVWDGWCDAGCPIGAIANPLMTYIPRAQKAGAVFQADSHISRILHDEQTNKAIGVEYFDSAGKRHQQHADLIILAANTVENARVLLNSKAGGLANKTGTLGHYLSEHPAVTVYGIYDEDTQCYMGPTGGAMTARNVDKQANPNDIFGAHRWEIGLVLKPNDLLGVSMTRPDLFGEELAQFMKVGSHKMAAMSAICEDVPVFENRIELDDKLDQYGIPKARIVYTRSAEGEQLAAHARDIGLKAVKASGAKHAWSGPVAGQHICGGTIMGKSGEDSVCNSYGITHEISNLVIGGQSTFPTCSDANTTFTAHATSERTADYLLANWQQLIA